MEGKEVMKGGGESSIQTNEKVVFFFVKQKTAYELLRCLVGSEMCIRDRSSSWPQDYLWNSNIG